MGDISHTLPVVRAIQDQWPETRLTWIIGRREHPLVEDIPGIEFITFDKSRRWHSLREIRRQLKGRHFDVLLHMQMSLRASLVSLLVSADIRLGFDRQRAKDMQWLFTNYQIPHCANQHVLDSLMAFAETIGVQGQPLRWDIPIPEYAQTCAREAIPETEPPTLVISPCSAHAYRNWTPEGYAQVADHAIQRHGMRVILTGGLSQVEQDFGQNISAIMEGDVLNIIGRTDLKQLLAILQRATVLISPDSGPAHLATAVGTPVIGLYAATNPDRAGPYLSDEWTVNRYPEALAADHGRTVEGVKWGTRVRDPGTMERITAEEVCRTLDHLLAALD